MRRALRYTFVVLAAIVLGVASAWLALTRHAVSSVQNGPWLYDPMVGSQAAGPYLRAQVAHVALLALNNSETVYFVADQDSTGDTLRCQGTYRIDGRDFDARWWSITAYGEDGFLMANDQDRYSFNMTNLARDVDGSYTISLSRTPRSGNWIPLGAGDTFSIWLRFYNPSPALREHLATMELPRIVREDGTHANAQ